MLPPGSRAPLCPYFPRVPWEAPGLGPLAMALHKRVCSPELFGATAHLRESPADIETGHKLQKGAGDRIKAKLVLQGNSDRSSRVKEYPLFCSFSFCLSFIPGLILKKVL